ncbi:hypothetical protein ACS127_01775 [Amphibacillus sp. Q70]|uniref:hypothetical protein n=1 Tax=Amphibacillus sp. Q70 TaxID=3453416 RepID=UPI003F83AAFA
MEIARVLDCSVKDLIEDDVWKVYYDEIVERFQNNPIFKSGKFFSIENLNFLEKLLTGMGIIADITPNNALRTVYIRNKQNMNIPIYFDITLRVHSTCLEVIDLYIYVNREIISERNIKDCLIQAIEIYTKKINVNQIIMYNINGKAPDQFDYLHEDNLLETTYHCDPTIEIDLLKSRGFTLQKSSFFPGLGDTWIKLIKDEIQDEKENNGLIL